MGTPLILTINRNNSPENSNPVVAATTAVKEIQTQTEIPEHEEDKATVNGKLDISIRDNSINEKSESDIIKTYHHLNDFKHNYHWFP